MQAFQRFDKKLNCRRQTARSICVKVMTRGRDLLKQVPGHIMHYHAEFVKRCRRKYRTPKIGGAGTPLIGGVADPKIPGLVKQEAQLMLTTGSTRLAVSRGQQTWYHSTCYI